HLVAADERRIAGEAGAHPLADEECELIRYRGGARGGIRAARMEERRIEGEGGRGRDLAAARIIGEADIPHLTHREAAQGHRVAARERACFGLERDLVKERACGGGRYQRRARETDEVPGFLAGSRVHDDRRARNERAER